MRAKTEAKPDALVADRVPKVGNDTKRPRRRAVAERREHYPVGAPLLATGAARAYEELLHFFNASPDLLCIASLAGKFQRLNSAWEGALGWRNEELQARSFMDFVHPDDRPATLAEMDKLAGGVTTICFENRYACQSGSWKWLQWTARLQAAGRTIFAIARDVTQQKRLEQEILEARDRERDRLGRELHDGLCQNLAAIAALSHALARRLAPAAAAESAAAREIGQLLSQTIGHARELARGLNPLHLEAIGLVAALTSFCINTEAVFETTCRLYCDSRPECSTDGGSHPCSLCPHAQSCPVDRDAARQTHLYRIVQEAVNNAITHGRAKRIEVRFGFQNRQGTLTIQDDGIGMGAPLDCPRGIGLQSMAYRARLIGGSLSLNRRTRRATVVTCVFPLPPANPNP